MPSRDPAALHTPKDNSRSDPGDLRAAQALGWLVEQYLRDVATRVPSLAGQDAGREVLGAVPGRPREEDEEIGIDRVCDLLLDDWCRRINIPLEIHSEHGVRRPDGGAAPPQYLVAIDPFDGSGLFRRGLPAEWWSVLTVYRASDLAPICGGAVDILREELYLAQDNAVQRVSLASEDRVTVSPKRLAGLRDQPVIAAFLMEPAYLTHWTRNAAKLLEVLVRDYPAVRIWPNGGSCVYPWLAAGLVHAYIMFNEPRGEIDPGLAFAAAAGFPAYAVQQSGELEPYRFDPARSTGRVPFFIAASTDSLAHEIVSILCR